MGKFVGFFLIILSKQSVFFFGNYSEIKFYKSLKHSIKISD